MVKMGHYWFGVDRWGCRSSKGVDCDILTQGLIGLIEYSYHQGISSFLKAQLECAWPRAISGWLTDRKAFCGAHK
jgi:hypothetical protein